MAHADADFFACFTKLKIRAPRLIVMSLAKAIPQNLWITLWKKRRVDQLSSRKTEGYSTLHRFRSLPGLSKTPQQPLHSSDGLPAGDLAAGVEIT